jgi:hypothetical protein
MLGFLSVFTMVLVTLAINGMRCSAVKILSVDGGISVAVLVLNSNV